MTALVLALALAIGADQSAISAARDLYAAAAYEDALAALERAAAGASAEDTRAIAQYRAFCLLALGRTLEAERAIETLVATDPAYRPDASDVSPRVRAAFADVRRRTLPGLIQQRYAAAKDAFDRKEFAAAAAGFSNVLTVMNDADVAAAVAKPPFTDLRVLAAGFRDLAASAAPPPPIAATPVAAPPPPAAAAPKPAAVVPNRVFTAADSAVVPPVTVRQVLPSFPGDVLVGKHGALEIVIDETGAVESAMMRRSISSAYDTLALGATRTWRYEPAKVDGKPVKYRKSIAITVKPRS